MMSMSTGMLMGRDGLGGGCVVWQKMSWYSVVVDARVQCEIRSEIGRQMRDVNNGTHFVNFCFDFLRDFCFGFFWI